MYSSLSNKSDANPISPTLSFQNSRRRLDCEDDLECMSMTPEEKVRKVVAFAIDNAIDSVDLSDMSIMELPSVISELQHIMVATQDCIRTNTLKLFLSSNALEELTEDLFKLRNLSVLSLRSNHLARLSPDVSLLSNLVELSLGGNNLKYLPCEILNLRYLTVLTIHPNPFLSPPVIEDSGVNISPKVPRICEPPSLIINRCSPPTLREYAFRRILSSDYHLSSDELANIPSHLSKTLCHARNVNRCFACHRIFVEPEITDIRWIKVLEYENVPCLFRWCGAKCCQNVKWKELGLFVPT